MRPPVKKALAALSSSSRRKLRGVRSVACEEGGGNAAGLRGRVPLFHMKQKGGAHVAICNLI